MSPALTRRALTRRVLVQGVGVALGVAALPAVEVRAAPTAFDAAAYVADLRTLGCAVYLVQRRSGPGWTFGISSPAHLGFGEDFRRVMERWDAAIAACPDHVARVVAHVGGGFL